MSRPSPTIALFVTTRRVACSLEMVPGSVTESMMTSASRPTVRVEAKEEEEVVSPFAEKRGPMSVGAWIPSLLTRRRMNPLRAEAKGRLLLLSDELTTTDG